MPGYNNSSRDGFAVRSCDIKGAGPSNPRILRVIETTAAGSVSKSKVIPGTAIRLMTGAPIPEGADAVVSFEDTDNYLRKELGDNLSAEIGIMREEPEGANIRIAGDQIKKNEKTISRGTIIGPAEAGIAASMGLTSLNVIRRPEIAVITTGEELVNPGVPLKEGKIYSGNNIYIAAQLQRYGSIPRILGIAKDNKTSLIRKILKGTGTDMIISTGGVATGDRDLVVGALAELGKITFHGLNIFPGKYSAFALLNMKDSRGINKEIPYFALSGNPAASMVGMEVLVRPAILKMMGKDKSGVNIIEAVSDDEIKIKSGLRRFIWVRTGNKNGVFHARLINNNHEGFMKSIAASDGLAIIPEEVQKLNKGSKLRIILPDWH
jgi:molybdopterin molybdotransferase